MNLRAAISILGEHYQRKAIEGMSIEELHAAQRDVNEPEFSKSREWVKPFLEATLMAKQDARDTAKTDAALRKADRGLRIGMIALAVAVLALMVGILGLMK